MSPRELKRCCRSCLYDVSESCSTDQGRWLNLPSSNWDAMLKEWHRSLLPRDSSPSTRRETSSSTPSCPRDGTFTHMQSAKRLSWLNTTIILAIGTKKVLILSRPWITIRSQDRSLWRSCSIQYTRKDKSRPARSRTSTRQKMKMSRQWLLRCKQVRSHALLLFVSGVEAAIGRPYHCSTLQFKTRLRFIGEKSHICVMTPWSHSSLLMLGPIPILNARRTL